MKFNYVLAAVLAFSTHQVIAGGPIDGCLQLHTVVAGDSCDGIAATFQLTPDAFYGMNPGLHHAGDHLCDNLDNDKKYCVCVKEPCVAEPAPDAGNSTATISGSSTSTELSGEHVDISSPGTSPSLAAAVGSSSLPSSSTTPKNPSSVARSVSSSSLSTSSAVSEKLKSGSRLSISVIIVTLSVFITVSL